MRTTLDCDSVHRFWLEEGDGRQLTSAERQQLDAHLSSCHECRLEFEVISAAAYDPAQSPAPPLNDLSRRRLIDAVLQKAEAVDSLHAKGGASTTPRQVRSAAVGVFLAVAVATIAVVLVVRWHDDTIPVLETATSISTPVHLLLVSGVSPAEATVAEIGDSVVDGGEWAVERGQLALSIDRSVTLFLQSHSRVRVGRDDASRIAAELVHGQIVVHKDPQWGGPGLVVTTPAGKVVVTGTRFSVAVTDDETVVRVYEGTVRVEEDGYDPREIAAGESSILGSNRVWPLEVAELQGGIDLQETMGLLASSSPAILELESAPSGAAVWIGGALLGYTPVRAAVEAGHRDLELTLPGLKPLRESVTLRVGETTSLSLVLSDHLDGTEMAAAHVDISPGPQMPRMTSVQPLRDPHLAPAGTPPTRDATDALLEAQGLREQQRWTSAAAAYEELIRVHPSSAEARVARVSLGTIQLNHLGLPESALAAFDGYLASDPDGTLAEEASLGRAMALQAMGQQEEAIAAFERFLANHPSSMSVPLAIEQLEELR